MTKSGLVHSVYDGRAWTSEGVWSHIRMPTDSVTYLLKAVRLEERRGIERSAWKSAARRGLDAFCGLWERDPVVALNCLAARWVEEAM